MAVQHRPCNDTICHSPKLETIKSPLTLTLDKLIVVCSYNGIRMNELPLRATGTDESHKLNVESKRPGIKDYTL